MEEVTDTYDQPERCNECSTIIKKLKRLPDGHENDEYYCPVCGAALGVGFEVVDYEQDN